MLKKRMFLLRNALVVWLVASASVSMRGDEILFIGNSFTLGSAAAVVNHNGGVPKLFEAIALAKGRQVATTSLAVSGKSWSFHLAQPVTGQTLASKTWNWVVLQDASTLPTHIGDVKQFMQDGEAFSDRISKNSPTAGILLFETWARPPGNFYQTAPGNGFSGPAQMMSELHQSYGHLQQDLAAKDPNREVRVALVGTAFARVAAEYPAINLNARDHHHASAEGYYLAALVIYETIYHDSALGAPTQFYHGALVIPTDEAVKLQAVADEVAGRSPIIGTISKAVLSGASSGPSLQK